jgi:hypothetical protein
MLAERRGLSDEKLATIVAGQRPSDLTRDEVTWHPRWSVMECCRS